jgi:hypothetical protein
MPGLLACYCHSMIPYDDLVAALTTWRARQGLPVARSAAAASSPSPQPPGRQHPAPAVSDRPPPARSTAPLASELGDFEDSALVEDPSYEAVGEDYVMQLGIEQSAEPTAIGPAPEPPPARRAKRPDRW